ncbi:MAG: 1-deoxy-D-xylulose-5-phosphate synthase N-terminal domain-containing protein, partial [Hydrogenoanaerobacterium sp.]
MEIKDKIEEIIEKIKNDKTLAEDFKKDPVKTVEGLLGVDLPDEAVKGIIEGVFNAKSGHPGGSLSIADILTYLYFCEMNVDVKNPRWDDRDRLVLSKGHVAPALYSTLAHKGFFPVDELKSLRKIGSMLQGHPDMNKVPGVDMTSGSLGQGISAACGMAKAAKLLNKSYKVFAILGDGEIEEGQVWEASM